MRFIAGLFIGSVIATALGMGVEYATSKDANHKIMEAEHKQIIAEWDRDRAKKEAEHLQLLLDAARRSQPNPVSPKGQVVPAGDLIPAPAVPFPVEPAK